MAESHIDSLTKAQREVNHVIELLGKYFVAAKHPGSTNAAATATRLKQTLPVSWDNFQRALDEVNLQIHHAKLVMRRDLALLTEQPEPELAISEELPDTQTADMATMEPTSAKLEPPITPQVEEIDREDTKADTAELDNKSVPAVIDDVDMAETADTKQDLKLDTTSKPAQPAEQNDEDQDKAPDTAFSNNADMDSLFNDPVSAVGEGAASNEAFDFGNDDSNANDFDFGELLDAGNDEDATIIPGLHDFTNGSTIGGEEPDFSALFGTATSGADDSQQPTQSHDFNFDDIMDFGISGGETGAENTTNNDFDIDFS